MKFLKIAVLAIALTLGMAAIAKFSHANDNYELARRILLMQNIIQSIHNQEMDVARNLEGEEVLDEETQWVAPNEIPSNLQNLYFDSQEANVEVAAVIIDAECEQKCIDKEFVCNNSGRPEFICETEWRLCDRMCSVQAY